MPVERLERPAEAGERDRMRAASHERGASLRQPVAWLKRRLADAGLLFGVALFATPFLMFLLSPLWILFQAVRPLCDPAGWSATELFFLQRMLVPIGVLGPLLLYYLGWRRSLRSLAADAFPGDRVTVWSVRGATAAYHEKNTWERGQGRPDGTGDSLYFETDAGVFCLSGPEWRAWAQEGTPPPTLAVEGAFPAADFDVVVMPRCRKPIRVIGSGALLPLKEYVYDYDPVALDFAHARDETLGAHYDHQDRQGQIGLFHPCGLPWHPRPAPPSATPEELALAAATRTLRPATLEERKRLRAYARANGATWRAPAAWLRRVGRTAPGLGVVVFYLFLGAGYLLYIAALFVAGLFARSGAERLADETVSYWILWIAVPGTAVIGAPVCYLLRAHRCYAPLRADAAGGEVEIWAIRTAGAGYLLRNEWYTDAFALRKRGSYLYFDLADGDVLALEGADWEALARGETPEDMEVTGVFPSDAFEVVVAPHSRRVISVTGKGKPLPFHEWVSRYGDEEKTHALFRDALREARRGEPERNGCAVFRFHPPVRPWAEPESFDGTEKADSLVPEKTP